ncbi:hypothetical protein VPH35_006258 [Triticum aestivum]
MRELLSSDEVRQKKREEKAIPTAVTHSPGLKQRGRGRAFQPEAKQRPPPWHPGGPLRVPSAETTGRSARRDYSLRMAPGLAATEQGCQRWTNPLNQAMLCNRPPLRSRQNSMQKGN